MKKSVKITMAAFVALSLSAPVAVSANGYGAAGCGLGAIVFGSKPGMIQVLAATTNATFYSQTFGITTGTSECGGGAVKVQAEQKNITIDIDCPENIPNVHADREKTAWVLTNLLSNAIRYSYEHSNILLTVKEVENRIQLSVKDVGKGIDPKYQHKIFDRYFQIPGSNKSGTGLGLAISKEFIEAQGGKISLFSEIGKGSTFTVTLNKAIS